MRKGQPYTRLVMLRTLWGVYRNWRRFPHERLGQLLENAAGPDLFFPENDELVEFLDDRLPREF